MAVQLEKQYRNRVTRVVYKVTKREWVGSAGYKMGDGIIHSGFVIETDEPEGPGTGIRIEENAFLTHFEAVDK